MSRAAKARRIAAAAAVGGGSLGAVGAAGFGVLMAEARLARRWIGQPFDNGPDASGFYGDGTERPWRLAVLGDSSSVGLGCDRPDQTPGAIVAWGLAALTGRPVELVVLGIVGAQSSDLAGQVSSLLEADPHPDAVLIMIGANDVTHRVRPAVAVAALADSVAQVRASGAQVVVATCPDLGTIEPLHQPLRWVARHWSRQLAAAQTIAVVEAGGRTVSLGDLLGPQFSASPAEMFSADGFHPSPAGYARAAAVLLPSIADAVGAWPVEAPPARPDVQAGEGLDDVAHAAARAAASGGTEVTPSSVDGQQRGPRGRWAVLRRLRLPAPNKVGA